MKEKYKFFVKNMSILTISNFVSKILVFLMLPLYTNVLSTKEYGTIDIITTTINLCVPIFTISIIEAILRYSMEKNINAESVLNEALKIIEKGFILLTVVALIAMNILKIPSTYIILFLIYYLTTATSNALSYYTKGINNLKLLGISNIVKAIIMVSANCITLLVLKLNLVGYYISLITSDIIFILILSIPIIKKKNKAIKPNKELAIEMKNYSRPFVANSISWWINNASDKYLVLFFCGIELTGIYSIAYKIPNILEVIQNIFAQAWQISAIKEYKSKEAKSFFSTMYQYYNLILVGTIMLIILFLKPIAKILFAKEFYEAWKFVPFLLLAILFGALSGFLGSIYAANKDSKMYAKSTLFGAIINTMLNILLIPSFNGYGAAFATFISYLVIWIIRIKNIKKYIEMEIEYKRNIVVYILLVIMCLMTQITQSLIVYVIDIAIIIIVIYLYRKVINNIINKINSRVLK
ncbi:MAG: oligosaccharide flippase family protein [Mycoplasmatota bacterium]|nr:oligosaccharide flippase family protein [Mycoplasmatota bacterium]